MTWPPFFALLAIALVAWVARSIARAIATGVWTEGATAIARADRPGEFYFSILIYGLFAAGVAAVAVYQYRTGETPHWPIAAIVVGGVTARALVASLQSGEALDPAFSRREEPLQYWGLIAFLIAVLLATAWNALDLLVA